VRLGEEVEENGYEREKWTETEIDPGKGDLIESDVFCIQVCEFFHYCQIEWDRWGLGQ